MGKLTKKKSLYYRVLLTTAEPKQKEAISGQTGDQPQNLNDKVKQKQLLWNWKLYSQLLVALL